MTSKSKDSIKAFFETGDKPTEAQFIDLIDSYVDKSGSIGDIETAASAGTTGFCFVSARDGGILTTAQAQSRLGVTIATTAQATAGTSDAVLMTPLKTQLAINNSIGAGQLVNVQTFSSAGTHTWTKPSNVDAVEVWVVGAGGGGGGNANAGSNGEQSYFGTHCTAAGGSGGASGGNIVPVGGAGGSGVNGNINLPGGGGGHGGIIMSSTTSGDAIPYVLMGEGGESIFSTRTRPFVQSGGGSDGLDAGGYGGGGGGCASDDASNGKAGGGGGGSSYKYITSGLNSTETVFVGSGGAGGTQAGTRGGNGSSGIVVIKSYS